MLKYLTSMGADSAFEKNRLMLTAKSLEAPDEHILKKALKTFQGEDDETRSQIAFATIIKKIITSDSNDSWIYLLKNLIILDRVVSEQCFCHEIADLQLPNVEQYYEKNSKYIPLKTDVIIRNYWKLIRYTARLLRNCQHISYYSRSQRSQFLSTLTPSQIIQQMQSLNECSELIFVLMNSITSTKGLSQAVAKALIALKKSGLISYLLLQVLYKLISFYSSQMLCVNKMVSIMARDTNMELLSLEEVRKFRQLLTRFKTDSSQIIQFIQDNKDIKGFQVVSYRDLDPMPENSIVKSIDQYISERLNREDQAHKVHSYISESKMQIMVHHKPRMSGEEHFYQARRNIGTHRSELINNPFENHISSFSEDFPQKEMMTIDLIIAIKQEEEREAQNRDTSYEEVINYDERETCVVNHQINIPEHLQFNSSPEIETEAVDKAISIFSDLTPIWNFE